MATAKPAIMVDPRDPTNWLDIYVVIAMVVGFAMFQVNTVQCFGERERAAGFTRMDGYIPTLLGGGGGGASFYWGAWLLRQVSQYL